MCQRKPSNYNRHASTRRTCEVGSGFGSAALAACFDEERFFSDLVPDMPFFLRRRLLRRMDCIVFADRTILRVRIWSLLCRATSWLAASFACAADSHRSLQSETYTITTVSEVDEKGLAGAGSAGSKFQAPNVQDASLGEHNVGKRYSTSHHPHGCNRVETRGGNFSSVAALL